MNAVRVNRSNEFISSHMGWPATYSALLHIFVFVLATFGLPHIARDREVMDVVIPIEMIDLSEVSQSNVLDKPQEDEVQDALEKRKPVYNQDETPPELSEPHAPELNSDIPEPLVEKERDQIPDVTEIKKPPKPKNKPRPPKPKAQEKPKQPERDINSLLKSLTPDEPEEVKPRTQENNQGQTSQIADFSKTMTRSELDDLNRGVQPCWNVNAGGRDAEDLIVDLRVFVNPDLRVREVQILDKLRYSTDSHFKAAAEAARRALLNPRCSQLRLPPEKYEFWKVFIYTFDPSQML